MRRKSDDPALSDILLFTLELRLDKNERTSSNTYQGFDDRKNQSQRNKTDICYDTIYFIRKIIFCQISGINIFQRYYINIISERFVQKTLAYIYGINLSRAVL